MRGSRRPASTGTLTRPTTTRSGSVESRTRPILERPASADTATGATQSPLEAIRTPQPSANPGGYFHARFHRCKRKARSDDPPHRPRTTDRGHPRTRRRRCMETPQHHRRGIHQRRPPRHHRPHHLRPHRGGRRMNRLATTPRDNRGALVIVLDHLHDTNQDEFDAAIDMLNDLAYGPTVARTTSPPIDEVAE